MSVGAMGVILLLSATSRLPDLDVVAKIESNHNPRAVSRAGAQGICQIMPQTWRAHARRGERWHNPAHNRAVAWRYLHWIQNSLRSMGDPQWNNPTHILACYNGGIGQFRRCGFRIDRMPAETRTYVQRYLRYAGGG